MFTYKYYYGHLIILIFSLLYFFFVYSILSECIRSKSFCTTKILKFLFATRCPLLAHPPSPPSSHLLSRFWNFGHYCINSNDSEVYSSHSQQWSCLMTLELPKLFVSFKGHQLRSNSITIRQLISRLPSRWALWLMHWGVDAMPHGFACFPSRSFLNCFSTLFPRNIAVLFFTLLCC